jgi:hypothetical protein
MASSGATAWAKYFQGKGDIETTMKKSSPAYDPATVTKKIGDIPAGTKITYLKTTVYEAKALIQFAVGANFWLARVPFDNIAKPGVKSSGAASLKPQAFGVLEKPYTMAEYKKIVSDKIEERKDLSTSLKTYLAALFDYHSGGGTKKTELTAIFKRLKDDLPLNDINKDFGEVLGPVALYNFQLLSSKKIKISNSAKVFVPVRPNEPLMDYAIIDGNKKYTISAKSGTTTNVVKPADIIMLVNKRKDAQKLAQTPEYKLLQILADNTTLLGPVRAVAALFPKLIKGDAALRADGKSYDTSGFAAFINQNEYLRSKKQPTFNEIMYECEKMIQKETKEGSLKMNHLFSMAIQEQVLYVKFELDSTGVGDWSVIASDDIMMSNKRIYLRSKNGYTRASDRMGIQV